MIALAGGVWYEIMPARMIGMELTATMTVVRLADGSVLVHSPLPLTPQRRADVESLGRVTHLYVPSAYHDIWIDEWAAAYPDARVHAPATLPRTRRTLRVDRVCATTHEPAFDGCILERHIDGCRLDETVLVCPAARTLVVADMLHNVGRPRQPWAALYSRLMGFHDRIAISRMLRWIAFADRAAARRAIDDLLALDVDRVIVGHGEPILHDGRTAVAQAYAWL